jgi:DNA mismatch endonuclease (patch repair protein)
MGSQSVDSRRRTVRIAPGVDVPYPEPSSAAATKIGVANRRRDTKPEVQLRSELHRRGLRFRKDLLVRTPDAKARVDICFTRARVAVFVDGCFWHSCPDHQHLPKRNTDYWVPKLAANVDRDRRVDQALRAAGWSIVRVWEHEDRHSAADRIEPMVRGASDVDEDGADA